MAEVRGRLGSRLLTVEAFGARAAGLHLVISQPANKELNEPATRVGFWTHQPDNLVEQPQGLTLDLDHLDVLEATNDAHRLKCYHLQVEFPGDLRK